MPRRCRNEALIGSAVKIGGELSHANVRPTGRPRRDKPGDDAASDSKQSKSKPSARCAYISTNPKRLVSRIVVVTERRRFGAAHFRRPSIPGEHREKILTALGALSTIPATDKRNQS
jgi:hypothetical protein